MKYVAIGLAFLFNVPNFAMANCVFGENLVDMALKRNLEAGKEQEIPSISALTARQKITLVNGLLENGHSETLNEFFDSLRGGIWLRAITDKAHNKNYAMYLYDTSDNICGFIASEDGKIVADIQDGGISNCQVEYSNYDWLPWFYTN